jgi:hypothetical protein
LWFAPALLVVRTTWFAPASIDGTCGRLVACVGISRRLVAFASSGRTACSFAPVSMILLRAAFYNFHFGSSFARFSLRAFEW